jgi:hypothetical protein
MKKIAMSMMFLGVSIMLVGLPSAFAGPATHFRNSTGWVEWNNPTTNPCTGEQMSVTAIFRTLSNITIDAAGGYHFQVQSALRGTAVGDETGNGYTFKETGYYEYNESAGGVYQHAEGFTSLLRSLDEDVPDVRLHLTIVYTYDTSDGTVKADIFHLDSTCEPF